MVDGNWKIYANKGEKESRSGGWIVVQQIERQKFPQKMCSSLVSPCGHLKANDPMMDLFLWWRDRFLAFHELCALYAGTGTFALSTSMMPPFRFTHSSCGACHANLRYPVVVEIDGWWWGWGFLLGSRFDISPRQNEPCELWVRCMLEFKENRRHACLEWG
jgi:hypothetical protein